MNLNHVFELTEIKRAPGGYEFRSPRHEEIIGEHGFNKAIRDSLLFWVSKIMFEESLRNAVYPDLKKAMRMRQFYPSHSLIKYRVPEYKYHWMDAVSVISNIFNKSWR